MPLTNEAKKYLNFGPQSGGTDGFTSSNDFIMEVGDGHADETWDGLENSLSSANAVTSIYELITFTNENTVGQVTRYNATFSLTSGDISEVSLKHNDGTYIFIESLKLRNTFITITPDYNTETVQVEIVFVRLIHREPIVIFEDDFVKIELPSLIQDGSTPFSENSPDINRLVYRTGELEPLIVYPQAIDTTVTTELDGNLFRYLIDVSLLPEDAFYDPFPLNTFIEVRIGTSSVNNLGIINIKWKSVQNRTLDHTWRFRIPIVFTIQETT